MIEMTQKTIFLEKQDFKKQCAVFRKEKDFLEKCFNAKDSMRSTIGILINAL